MNSLEYYFAKVIKRLHLKAIKNSVIHKNSKVYAGSHLVNVILDRYSYIGYDCTIINTTIGSFCSLGSNIKIGGASHTTSWVSTSPIFNGNKDHFSYKFSSHYFDPYLNTKIGSDVWIADNVMIKAGVSIGDGAVIGMGSIVTKDIPPFEVWAGNPAHIICKRFNDSIIEKLLKIQWWEWENDKIAKAAFCFNEPQLFVKKYT